MLLPFAYDVANRVRQQMQERWAYWFAYESKSNASTLSENQLRCQMRMF